VSIDDQEISWQAVNYKYFQQEKKSVQTVLMLQELPDIYVQASSAHNHHHHHKSTYSAPVTM